MTKGVPRCPWAVDVAVRVRTLREAAARATARHDPPPADATLASIGRLLDQAQAAADGRPGWIADWRGTHVALAYRCLHEAEVELVDFLSHDEIRAILPALVARGRAVLDPSDVRRTAIEQLPRLAEQRSPALPAAVRAAMRSAYEGTDEMHLRIRNFRNLLLRASAVILLFMAIVVIVSAGDPTAMPTCFQPRPPAWECPSGAHHATGGDVPIVAGLGVLGGALAAAFSIRKVRGTSIPYDIPIALAMLKPPMGALTAVAAILLLGGDFVPGFSELDSQRQILAYALVFGYAQQLITGLIDNQAHAILKAVPSKDPAVSGPAAPEPIATSWYGGSEMLNTTESTSSAEG